MAFGLVGLVMARTYAMARAYFLIGGLAYLGLWVYGMPHRSRQFGERDPTERCRQLAAFGLGVGMMLLGLTLAGQHDPTKSTTKAERQESGTS